MTTHRHCPLITSAALGVALLSAHSHAQFSSAVEIVPLMVTVTDRAGHYVPGLSAPDFTVLEDGRPQRLSHFAAVNAPLDLALSLDNSSSMDLDFPLAQEAARHLVARLGPGDRAALGGTVSRTFGAQELTSDLQRVDNSIRTLRASGATALYEAIYIFLRQFQRDRRAVTGLRRQAIVVLTDGVDTASRLDFDEVLDAVRRSDVVVYVILLDGQSRSPFNEEERLNFSGARFAMRALAQDSGGRLYTPRSAIELHAIYDAIAQELGTQYLLGYVPARAAGTQQFRRVAVSISGRDFTARTRAGYYPRP
jgi:Ca-activated chloride channel family protein